jgi:CRISPR/Cas system CMR-associated protein Cmr5 small subunit
MIGPRIVQTAVQPMPQLQHSKKFVEEEYASIVRQTPMIKGDY